jgi:hypothetical protein
MTPPLSSVTVIAYLVRLHSPASGFRFPVLP